MNTLTDYGATIIGRAALARIALVQLTAKRQRMGTQDGDDVELWKRERQLEDVLNARWIELQDEVERTSALIGRVATLESVIRDRDEERITLNKCITEHKRVVSELKRKVKELEQEKERRER